MGAPVYEASGSGGAGGDGALGTGLAASKRRITSSNGMASSSCSDRSGLGVSAMVRGPLKVGARFKLPESQVVWEVVEELMPCKPALDSTAPL